MSEQPIIVILEGGRYNGRPFQRTKQWHSLVIETVTQLHFYEAAGRDDEQGRPVFVFKSVQDRPQGH